jgi:ribonucleotide reductase beta subunit family protein with ferritin-like domain
MSLFKPWSNQTKPQVVFEFPNVYLPLPANHPLQSFMQMFMQTWIAEHIPFNRDIQNFESLPTDTRAMVVKILSFFIQAENEITDNLNVNFSDEFGSIYLNHLFTLQASMELIHAKTYALQLTNLLRTPRDVGAAVAAISTSQPIQNKYRWMETHFNSRQNILERVFAMGVAEGVLFQTSFAFIFKMKEQRCDLPGLFMANDYISRDEGLHCQYFAYLFKELRKAYQDDFDMATFEAILQSGVTVEKEFAAYILDDKDFFGITLADVGRYIDFVAAHMRSMFLDAGVVGENPFGFMKLYSAPTKHLFFESKETSYVKSYTKKVFVINDK